MLPVISDRLDRPDGLRATGVCGRAEGTKTEEKKILNTKIAREHNNSGSDKLVYGDMASYIIMYPRVTVSRPRRISRRQN